MTVSSDLHNYLGAIKLSTKEDFNATFSSDASSADSLMAQAKRYNFTKLLNVLFATELQRRADAECLPLISISLHPGVVATGGALDLFPSFMRSMLKALGKTPLQGAKSALVAAASTEVKAKQEKYKGAYLGPGGKLGRASAAGRDEKLAKELWELSEKAVKEILESKGSK